MTTKPGRAFSPADAAPRRRKRDAARTRETILRAALKEFCSHGFNGARVDRIVKRGRTNMRMIYHYFGSKAGLYLAVLERVYEEIRGQERQLHLSDLEPVEGMAQLIGFTFDYFAKHVDFITLINSENLLRARYLKQSRKVPALTMPLVDAIEDLLHRGSAEGVFRSGVDPVQLYVSIVAQSYFHISNRYTLSTMFRKDLGDAAWMEARRAHTRDLILGYLTSDPEQALALSGAAASGSAPPGRRSERRRALGTA